MKTLVEVVVWAVMVDDPNDGRPYPHAYFTDGARASQCLKGLNPSWDAKAVQTSIWRGDDGEFYLAKPARVDVDLPDRDAVLAKLTPAERRVLGVK